MLISRRAFTSSLLATPFVWGATRSWSLGLEDMRKDGEDIARRVAQKTGEAFAAGEHEVVVFLVGIADLAIADSPQDAPIARALAHIELIVDVVAATVAGEIYGITTEAGDIGGFDGATLRVDGHMTQDGPTHVGAWFEAPSAPIGRPTQATRVGVKGNLALRGASAPRAAYGPLAGTFSTTALGRKALFGTAALWEVERS